jgi:hypothetical protein
MCLKLTSAIFAFSVSLRQKRSEIESWAGVTPWHSQRYTCVYVVTHSGKFSANSENVSRKLAFPIFSVILLPMKKYNSFQMTLLPTRESEAGRDIYTVYVSIPNYELGEEAHFLGLSARQAFSSAMEFINEIVGRMCARCSRVTPESDETYRNAGICQSCYEKISL